MRMSGQQKIVAAVLDKFRDDGFMGSDDIKVFAFDRV